VVRSHLAYHLRRRRWRSAVGATLVIGLLGGVALAALAGARRTASAHAEYLRSTRASDVLVNTPVPDLDRPEAIARLPGVADSANYVGLYGFPVVDGAEAEEFGLTGLFGSVDGRFFEQDRATAEQGRLPAVDATDEIALTQLIADLFGVGLGDALTYVYRRPEDDAELLRATYRVVGIVELPPLLVDDADRLDGALLPPAATARVIETAYYSWQGIRLEEGPDGIDTFVSSLASDPTTDDIPPIVKRVDDITAKVQRAIRPLAVALALFGAAVAVAALVLGAQTLARLVAQWSTDQPTLRAMGAGRGLRASLSSVEAVAAALAGAGSAVAVAAALSPLAPVGSLRTIVPSTGVRFDGLVLGAGGGLLAASLLLAAAATAWWGGAAPPPPPHGRRVRHGSPSGWPTSGSRSGPPSRRPRRSMPAPAG
jgi:hypothetical protein